PHAAAGCADVERLRRPSRVGHRERGHPPAVRGGAEVAEREALEEPREGVLGGGRAVRAWCGGVGGRRGRRPFRPRLLCDEGGGVFFFKQKTAYEIGLGIPAEPLFRSTFLKASHSFRNRLLVICKNAYLFAT